MIEDDFVLVSGAAPGELDGASADDPGVALARRVGHPAATGDDVTFPH
jgi:hypothetical protein